MASSKVIAKLMIQDPWKNERILIVKLWEDGCYNYVFYTAKTNIPLSLSNLQLREPLPVLAMDYSSNEEAVKAMIAAIGTGTERVYDHKIYE